MPRRGASPGADFHDYHKAAERVLAQGYIDLGLCEGTLDEVLESGAYKQFYMHRAGHWLGMDVHDAGLYQVKGASQKLVPGMVLTVEPGTYIRPGGQRARGVLEHRRAHRGRRARDGDGHENLTAATPKTVAEVEAACAVNADGAGIAALAATLHRSRRAMLHDVVIVGAGPVGATLALAIADADLDVVALDARAGGRDAARRSLARAVARRAADLRAPRRLGRAGGRRRTRSRRSRRSTFRRPAASA